MGGVLIPERIYYRDDFFYELRQANVHWTDYGGDAAAAEAIKKLIHRTTEYTGLLRMTVINYDQSTIQHNSKKFEDIHGNLSQATIYTKFPERIVYGLLKKRGERPVHQC